MRRALITELPFGDPQGFRVPDLDGETAEERELAHSNRSEMYQSSILLSRLVPGHAFNEVVQGLDGGQFAAQTGATVHRQISGLELLENLTQQDGLRAPAFKVIRDRYSAPGISYFDPGSPPLYTSRLRYGGLIDDLSNGYSLIFNFADLSDPSLAQLALHFERVFQWPININVYVAVSEQDAFGFHWDDHEVIILPLHGKKQWEVGAPASLSKVVELHAGTPQDTEAVWTDLIEPGWSLYIPRGWPHRVRATGDLTVHLTVTIPRPRAIDALMLAAEASSEDVFEGMEAKSTQSLLPWPGLLGSKYVIERVRSGLERRFGDACYRTVVRRRISMPSRHVGDLETLLSKKFERCAFRNPYGGGWLIGPKTSDGTVIVGAGGRIWCCDPAVVRLIGCVAGTDPVPLQDLSEGAVGSDQLLTSILCSGLLDVVDQAWRPLV